MEERNYRINWLGLFIKVIVFVVVVLLAIWLVSKIIRRDKGLSFEENNKLFQEASVEYFKKNLPEEGKIETVTLKQLINWDYIKQLKTNKKACDSKKSNSKIELIDNYYSIKTELICGNESETTYIKLGNEECTNCDVKVEGLEINKKEETKQETPIQEPTSNSKGEISTNTNVNNNIEPSEPAQIILYEYVKEVDEYSDWYEGKVTGKNIENSTKEESYSKFCKRTNMKKCITDKTENASNYTGYKKVSTWKETIDIYRYKITIVEYKYTNLDYLEGYTKTGKTKIAE